MLDPTQTQALRTSAAGGVAGASSSRSSEFLAEEDAFMHQQMAKAVGVAGPAQRLPPTRTQSYSAGASSTYVRL